MIFFAKYSFNGKIWTLLITSTELIAFELYNDYIPIQKLKSRRTSGSANVQILTIKTCCPQTLFTVLCGAAKYKDTDMEE